MKTTKLTLLALLVSVTVGCGEGFRSNVMGSSTNNKVDISNELSKAEEATRLAQEAMAEANAVIAEITDDKGNINIGLFKSSKSTGDVQAQFILNGVMAKLREVFDKVFAKVALVKEQFNVARQKLAEAAAKLDQNDPTQAAQYQMIMTQLARIDQLEIQFKTAMTSLAGKLDLAVNGLNAIITGATSFIPGWGSIIGLALDFLVMSDVRALIMELKMKLLAL